MKAKNSFFKKFTLFDLIMIAMLAALGIAIKPVILPLVHIITGPLFIPGGAIAGGFYMMWIVVGAGIVKKRGTATMIAAVQAIMVLSVGSIGTHGLMSIITYMAPGLGVELVLWVSRQRIDNSLTCFLAGMIANMSGTLLSNFVFFRLPLIPLVLALAAGALSGGIGGLAAYSIIKGYKKIDTAVTEAGKNEHKNLVKAGRKEAE